MREDQYSGSGNNESSEDDATYEEGGVVDHRSPQKSTPRRAPQKAPQGTTRAAPAQGTTQRAPPANAPLPTTSTQTQPSNPYMEGTKKFLVAEKLIAGELDRKKVAKEVGVSNQTIYNVISDLRTHGYTIADVNSPKSTSPPPTPRATSTPRTTQQSPQGEIEGSSVGETTSRTTPQKDMQGNSKYYPGETTQEDEATQGRSQRAPREPGIHPRRCDRDRRGGYEAGS